MIYYRKKKYSAIEKNTYLFFSRIIKLLIFFLLFLLTRQFSPAQYTLTLHENLITKDLPTFWNITIATNSTKEKEEIQLRLSLSNAGEKVIYEVLSPYLLLNNNQVRTLNSSFSPAQTLTNELTSNTLPDGSYEVSYRENKSNKLLKRKQFTVNGDILTFFTEVDSGKFEMKKVISTTGTARLTTAFNNPQGFQSEQKPFYNRLEANPTLVFGGFIPVGASILLSTEQGPGRQPMTQVGLLFDCNYFGTLLDQKAMSKIEEMKPEESAEMEAMKEKFLDKKNKNFEEMKENLSSPEAMEEIAKAEAYHSLEKQMANLEKAMDQKRLEELGVKYGVATIEELEAKKDSIPRQDYNEMKFQFTTAAAYEDAQAQMKKLEKAKKSSDKLLAQKERVAQLERGGYMQMMRDPRYRKEMLGKLGMSNPATNALGGLKSLSVGTSYPLYTPLTMNGVRSTGINVEWNPGIAYFAFTRGVIRNPGFDSTFNRYVFKRDLLAGRIGIGKKNASHFILSYLNSTDRGNVSFSPIDSTVFNPGQNLVLGIDMQLALFKKKFVTQMEINGSATNADNYAIEFPSDFYKDFERVVGVVRKMNFAVNSSSRFDFAGLIRSELRLFNGNTVMSSNLSYTGPGYTSFTAPYLMVDQFRYEVKLNQSLWRKRFSAGGFYKYVTDNVGSFMRFDSLPDHLEGFIRNDNLPGSKDFTTTLQGFGAEATLNLPKLPSLWIKYLPVTQVSDFSSFAGQPARLASEMITAGASYNYNFSKVSCNTQLFGSQYNILDEFWKSNLHMTSLMLMHTIAFSKGMNLTFTFFRNSSPSAGTLKQSGVSLAGTGMIKKKIITGLEFHYLGQTPEDAKAGATLNAGVRILKNLNTQFRLTVNSIRSVIYGNRNECFGNLVLNFVW